MLQENPCHMDNVPIGKPTKYKRINMLLDGLGYDIFGDLHSVLPEGLQVLCLDLTSLREDLGSEEKREIQRVLAATLGSMARDFKEIRPELASQPIKIWFKTDRIRDSFRPVLTLDFEGMSIEQLQQRQLDEMLRKAKLLGGTLLLLDALRLFLQ
jgi:hypothetical protein